MISPPGVHPPGVELTGLLMRSLCNSFSDDQTRVCVVRCTIAAVFGILSVEPRWSWHRPTTLLATRARHGRRPRHGHLSAGVPGLIRYGPPQASCRPDPAARSEPAVRNEFLAPNSHGQFLVRDQ